MTYNTGNPIGSTDARDRLDNSENLDLAVNSLSQTFVDRLGVTRDTLEGVYQKSAYYRAGTFDAGYTLTNNRQTLAYGNIEYSWSGAFPKVVESGATPETSGGVGAGAWVDRTQETLKDGLASQDGDLFIPSIYKSAGCIMASRHGVVSGVDCASVIQDLQDLSEQHGIPLDFSGIPVVSFSGKVQIGSYFHWRSSGKFNTVIRPITKSRTALGVGPQGVYAWFGPKDPTVSIKHAMLEDIGFDGGYDDVGSHNPPIDRLIRAFCWHAHTGAIHQDITALRVHAVNCPHEFWEGYTTGGGQIDGIRALFCSGDVADPTTSCVGCNFFKCMNGTIDSPGAYKTYTIRNIVSFGNTARGMRTLNDFKRGCEKWTISACTTVDMNDCHHSTDGSRYGTFEASNQGWQTGASRATKNFLEIQGDDIDVFGFKYDANKTTSTKQGIAAVMVTDYEYPANGGDGVGTHARQSSRVNIHSGYAKNVNQNAVRLINTYHCSATKIAASQCLYGAVSVEVISPHVDTDSLTQLQSTQNELGGLNTYACGSEFSVTSNGGAILLDVPRNEYGGCRGSIAYTASVGANYKPVLLNESNTLCNTTTNYTVVATKTDNANPPIGVPYAFTLNDINTSSVQTMDWNAKIPLSQANLDQLYIKLWALVGTASSSAVLVQEYTSAGAFIASSFKSFTAGAAWGELLFTHKASAANVAYVVVRLCPACDASGTASLTGTTSFAEVRISKRPL